MIALYIVAIPGFIPGIGRDAETHLGIAPTGTHASPLQVKVHHENEQMSSEEEVSHQKERLVIVSQEQPSHDHVISDHPDPRATGHHDSAAVHEQQPDQGNFSDSPTVLSGTAPLIQQQASLQLRGNSPIAWAATAPVTRP